MGPYCNRSFSSSLSTFWSNPSKEKDDAQDTLWIHIMHILNKLNQLGFMKERALELAV